MTLVSVGPASSVPALAEAGVGSEHSTPLLPLQSLPWLGPGGVFLSIACHGGVTRPSALG